MGEQKKYTRSDNFKLHPLAVYLVLLRNCDTTHGITIDEIREDLNNSFEITVDRNTVVSDLFALESLLNMVLEEEGERPVRYFWTNREYNAVDIMQLIDSVQKNVDLPPDQKAKLIAKAKQFISKPMARRVDIQNAVAASVFHISEGLQKKLDALQSIIDNGTIAVFNYPRYDFQKDSSISATQRRIYAFPIEMTYINRKPVLCGYYLNEEDSRKDCGYCFDLLSISPSKLEGNNAEITFYNVDCIEQIKEITQLGKYSRNRDKMPDDETIMQGIVHADLTLFRDKKEKVSIQCAENLLPVIADHFDNIVTVAKTESGYRVALEAAITPEFLGWVFSLGKGAKLLSPLHAVKRLKQMINIQAQSYDV